MFRMLSGKSQEAEGTVEAAVTLKTHFKHHTLLGSLCDRRWHEMSHMFMGSAS